MIISALRQGVARVNQSKRMIFFAWLVNVTLTLTVALPLLSQLDTYVKGTVLEERIVQRIEPNWFQTFQRDQETNPLARFFDYSMFGIAPFLNHYEAYLGGDFVKNVARFLMDLFFSFSVSTQYLNIISLLAFAYLLSSTFLAGGFVGIYAKTYRVTFPEFLIEGAKYFGRFFRLCLLSLIVYYLLFNFLFDWWTGSIPSWTAEEPTEMTPFIHYMIKNVVVILVLGLIALCFDYAKIRMVVDDRVSALFAVGAAVKFVTGHFWSVSGLYVILSLVGVVLVAVYGLVERQISQTGYWTILFVFMFQQLYMLSRFWLKASFYASQTDLYQKLAIVDHRFDEPSLRAM